MVLDLQINGLRTKDFCCDFWQAPDDHSIEQLCVYEQNKGINAFLATIITAPLEIIERNLQRIEDYRNRVGQQENLSQIIGVHLEGGLISQFGVHPEKYSQVFDFTAAKNLIKKFPSLIKLWTICPLMDTTGDITRLAQDHGVIISYGHSRATYHEALEAFDKYQVNMVTHWGNAMYVAKDFKQRDSSKQDLELLDSIDVNKINPADIGIGLAAYQNPNIYCTAIAGSQVNQDEHLDPRLLQQLATKKQDKFILVSDSVAHFGPVANLVGGLATLKEHSANAINAGISADLVQAATTKNIARLRLG